MTPKAQTLTDIETEWVESGYRVIDGHGRYRGEPWPIPERAGARALLTTLSAVGITLLLFVPILLLLQMLPIRTRVRWTGRVDRIAVWISERLS